MWVVCVYVACHSVIFRLSFPLFPIDPRWGRCHYNYNAGFNSFRLARFLLLLWSTCFILLRILLLELLLYLLLHLLRFLFLFREFDSSSSQQAGSSQYLVVCSEPRIETNCFMSKFSEQINIYHPLGPTLFFFVGQGKMHRASLASVTLKFKLVGHKYIDRTLKHLI